MTTPNNPKPVYARRWMLYAGLVFIVVLTISVIIGVHYSTNKKMTTSAAKPEIDRLATVADKDWYKKSQVSAKPLNQPPPKTTHSNEAQALPTNQVNDQNQTIDQDQDLKKAMGASISSNELKPEQGGSSSSSAPQIQQANGEQQAFLQASSQVNDYLGSSLQNPISHYELQAGTIIPGVLITGINSDLPGQIIGQVRENVYDSITGNHLLVPQGAKLIGVYDSHVAYGQNRVLIAWQRIIFPTGQSMDLKGMPGTDLSGYAGFNDQVNNHYFKIFGSVLLMSVLSAGAQLSQPQGDTGLLVGSAPSIGQTIAGSVGANVVNTATMMTRKNLQIQPSLNIRPGYQFNITVTKDMVFPNESSS